MKKRSRLSYSGPWGMNPLLRRKARSLHRKRCLHIITGSPIKLCAVGNRVGKVKHKHNELLVGLLKLMVELKKLRSENHDPKVEHNIHLLLTALFLGTQPSAELIRRIDEIPGKEIHYCRNDHMSSVPQSPEDALQCGWDVSVGASCHQFTSPDRSNVKFVSQDGHSEVIYDKAGHIVTASEDYGTYNFVDSRQDPVGHFYQDVLPWLIWGNDEKDSTDMRQRLNALVVYGGIESLISKYQP